MLADSETLIHILKMCSLLSSVMRPLKESGASMAGGTPWFLACNMGCICSHANVDMQHRTIRIHEIHIKYPMKIAMLDDNAIADYLFAYHVYREQT